MAKNIFYMGHAGVINFGGARIGGLSGIYNGKHYRQVCTSYLAEGTEMRHGHASIRLGTAHARHKPGPEYTASAACAMGMSQSLMQVTSLKVVFLDCSPDAPPVT